MSMSDNPSHNETEGDAKAARDVTASFSLTELHNNLIFDTMFST
jgi:hypothetical protein